MSSSSSSSSSSSAFLALPRELRDKIYTALLFPSHPPPHPSSTTHPALWHRAPGYSPPINNYSLCKAHTYANVLAANRQLHGEMASVVERARRRGELGVWGDCMVVAGVGWVSWGGGGGVTSVMRGEGGGEPGGRSWVDGVRRWGVRVWGGSRGEPPGWRTRVERVWFRVRVFEQGEEQGDGERWLRRTTAGAVFAALHQLLEHGMDDVTCGTAEEQKKQMKKQKKDVVIEEVVVNVVSTAPTCCRPREMAKHLLAQWSRLWGSDTAIEACHDGILLERIGTVRVCADGVECGRRVLRGELERGRGELRRIARRMR